MKHLSINNQICNPHFVVVQSLSCVQLFATPWTAACQASLPSLSQEFSSTHVHWVGYVIQPSSSIALFSSCPQSFPASGSFSMSQFFTSGGQSIGASASVHLCSSKIKVWNYLLTGIFTNSVLVVVIGFIF